MVLVERRIAERYSVNLTARVMPAESGCVSDKSATPIVDDDGTYSTKFDGNLHNNEDVSYNTNSKNSNRQSNQNMPSDKLELVSNTVTVSNVSVSGVQVMIDPSLLPVLLPNADRKDKIDTVPLDIEIDIPDNMNSIKIKLGVVYLQRQSMTSVILGCRFEWFYADSARKLAEYLASLKCSDDKVDKTVALKIGSLKDER
jgi:hypothetical protein